MFSQSNNHSNMENTMHNNIQIRKVEVDNDAFIKKVEDFVKKNNPFLYILTPCYASLCYIDYTNCIIETIEVLRRFNIPVKVSFCKNDSLVSRARNNLVASAMCDTLMTHMLFIDSDIIWNPYDVLKLLMADKGLVGGIYPLKKYNWNVLTESKDATQKLLEKKNSSQLHANTTDENFIKYSLVRYNVNFLESTLSIQNNLAKVRHLPTGFMMIKRSTIESMAQAFPSTKYTDDCGFLHGEEQNKWAYALFDCGVEEGHYFSEDWLFCHRWTKMGGNIYMDVSIALSHIGNECFDGFFMASTM